MLTEDHTLWNIDFAFSSTFELPAAEARKVLPPGLALKEVRPDVGLLSLTLFRFDESNEVFPGTVHELVAAVHVEPDLTLVDTPPNAALFVLNIVSDDERFVTDPYGIDRFPTVEGRRFEFDVDRDAGHVRCQDDTGARVFDLRILRTPEHYVESAEEYQSFCVDHGELWAAGAVFEVSKAEWQDKSQSAGALYPHELFAGIDVTTIDPHDCFAQKISEPGATGLEVYLPARPVHEAGVLAPIAFA